MNGIADGAKTPYVIEVNRMNEEDAAKAASLEKRCFSYPWRECDYIRALKKDDFVCLCAYTENGFAGFLMACTVLDECELLDIATEPLMRRMGVAEKLMNKMLEILKSGAIKTVKLEARKNNLPARSLYEKLGFKEVGERKKYYKDPDDDAVLYTLVTG